jgi:hypothetical protein
MLLIVIFCLPRQAGDDSTTTTYAHGMNEKCPRAAGIVGVGEPGIRA